jgi:hypothetical protein
MRDRFIRIALFAVVILLAAQIAQPYVERALLSATNRRREGLFK